MGKVYSQVLNRWDGGITNILRQDNVRYARKVTHFDFLTDPTKLNPYTDFAATTTDAGTIATIKLCKFFSTVRPTTGGSASVIALGEEAGSSGVPRLYYKTAIGSAWGTLTTNFGSANFSERVFAEYKGYAYFWRDTNARGNQHLDGAATFLGRANLAEGSGVWTYYNTAPFDTVSFVAQPIVHSKDDLFYIPFDNYIYVITAAAGTPTLGLTLPSNMVVTSICEYGNYLAIACRPKVPQQRNSVVFLWDRDRTLTTVTESIDWGSEDLEMIDTLDGILVGISSIRNTYTDTITFNPHLVFKYYGGGIQSARQIFELPFSIDSNRIVAKQKINNRILFMMSGTLGDDSTQTDGIWSFSKVGDRFSVGIEYLYNNATAVTSGAPKGFIKFGDYVVAAFTDNGTYKCNQISSSTYATAAATYETVIFNGGDSAQRKKLLKATLMTEPLPAAGSATLAYAADENIGTQTFTTMLTSNTDNDIRKDAVNNAGSGNLPEFQEIAFKMTSTGNAVITGLKFVYEEVDGKDNT